MTDELFSVEESLSPREKWIRNHGVTTEKRFDSKDGPWWEANCPAAKCKCDGTTEREAIDNLAAFLAKQGVPCWRTDSDL